MAKKFLSILLTLVLVLGLLPAAGAAAVSTSPTFSDMPDNWATEALESAVANGLLVGDDGKIMPDSPLTRAQMATIIARAFGATEEGDISAYTDVTSTDWFAGSMAKAYKMGVMQGYAGKMDPNSNITREQAFAVLARALKLEPASAINKTFEDEGEISDWAKGEVYALVNAGYIQGSNGRLNPQANISRAEFAQIMHNLIKQYIKAEGEYTEVADGNIMVNVPDVTLKNVTIDGDLIVGDGVGDGDLILDNVTIKGRLLARGGGVNSIIIIGGSVEGKVIVAKVDGDIRVSVEGGADVEVIVIDDGKDDVIIEGTVGTVEVSVPDVPVIIQNATISKIDVNCEGAADITIAETGSVTNVVIGGNSEGTALNVEGNVTNIETSAPDTVISGTGAVGTVTTNEGANNTAVTTPSTKVNNEGASGVTAGGGTEVPSGSTAMNNTQGDGVVTTPTGGGSTGGGSDSGDSVVNVSAISVDNVNETIILKVNETDTVTATVSPTNASNKKVTWSSSDEEVAIVDANGIVTGLSGGYATITATTVDGGFTATKHVVVGDILVPAHFANPENEGTLQSVIDGAAENSVIVVAPAEYKEQIVISKPLTLLGPNAGIAGYDVRNGEAIITYPDDFEEIANASLVYVTADNVVIKGLSFYTDEAEEGEVVREIWFTGYNNEFTNNRVISYTDKVAVHFGISDSQKIDNVRTFNEIVTNESTIVKNNYIESTASWSALYLQGRAGTVEGNTINGGNTALQIQPYWNAGSGAVRNNNLYGYNIGIWHNRADFGSGAWTYEDNKVFATSPTNPSQSDSTKWRGILVQSHGGEGWGGNQPKGDGRLPVLTLINNSIDGSDTIGKEKWDDSIGLYFYNNFATTAVYTIDNNTFENIKIGANNYYGNANLDDILTNNTFAEGSMVIGNMIKVPESGKVYNQRSGDDYTTIQAAINAAIAGDTILVGPGTYEEQLEINKPLTLLGPNADIAGYSENRIDEAIITYSEDVTDTREFLLLTAYTNDITVKGFSFENHTVNTTHLDATYEVYFNGENILFENNKLLLETNKAGLKIRGLGEEDALDGDYDYTGAVVRGNYIEGLNGTSNTVYIQGIGGTVEENVIVSDSVGIQVQPYSNLTGGIVQNNEISAYWFSIWHNSTSEGDAEWVYASNNITVREPLSVNQYIEKYGSTYQDIFKWYGIRIYPSSPNIQLLENTFDGSTAFDSSGLVKDKWIDIVGIQFYTGLTEASIFNIEDNTVSNVTIGVMDDAGRADLDLILAENTFPEGFNVLGNQIKMLEDGKIYISNTGVEYATIQAAIDAATTGDTILLGSGEYKIPWNGNVGLKLYKSLNIIGEDENNVVIRPETKGTPTTHRLIQTGYDQPAAVALKNITIDGNLTDGSNGGVSRGINVYNYGAGLGSSLSLENVTIQNIIDDSVHDTTGLYFLTGGNATSSIKNVTIKNYGWTGVLIGSLAGDGDQIINIDGLHIDGRNDKNYLTNGLDIRGSSYRNLIINANNVYVENCDYVDEDWAAFAIIVSPESGHYGSENVSVSLSFENSMITNSANALHFESSGRADTVNFECTIFDHITNHDLVWFGKESESSSRLTVNQSYSNREGSINYLISSEDLDSEYIGYDPIIYLPEITNSFNNAEYPTSDFGKDTMSFTLSNIYN